MTALREPAVVTRKVTQAAAPPRVERPTIVRLHATTALSRIMSGRSEDAPDALAVLDFVELATLASAARLLATLAGSLAGERERERAS